jgi:cytochrome c peroxidase
VSWLASLWACADQPIVLAPPDPPPQELDPQGWDWELPLYVPEPVVPEDNPMTRAKVELGRHLFYDRRLSQNEAQSCADCHEQASAFAAPEPTVAGSTGQPGVRNPMALVNVAYNATLTWANPALATLEQQIPVPLFGQLPVELGITDQDEVMARLLEEERYEPLFADAFPDPETGAPTMHEVNLALACFVRSLVSFGSPYDRYQQGERSALGEAELRGMTLFFSEQFECHHCHSGFNLSNSVVHVQSTFTERPFHNTGLYNIGGTGDYPPDNQGLYAHNSNPFDKGKFRPPTLRNIEVTGPYSHDGSVETLQDVLDNYLRGGRLLQEGPYAGDGALSPYKSGFLHEIPTQGSDEEDLLAFLRSLTDEDFLTDPRHADPW